MQNKSGKDLISKYQNLIWHYKRVIFFKAVYIHVYIVVNVKFYRWCKNGTKTDEQCGSWAVCSNHVGVDNSLALLSHFKSIES